MLLVYKIDYYERPNGKQPVVEWLDSLSLENRTEIDAKIDTLREQGLVLLSTKMMRRIKNKDQDFYELRGGQCRIALYFNRGSNLFVLLHGFLKKRAVETREIDRGRDLLHEYLST